MKTKQSILTLLLTAAFAVSANAAAIAVWDFQDSNLAPDTYDSNLVTGSESISLGSGLKSDGSNGSGWLDLSGDIELSTADIGSYADLAAAKSNNSFIEFTLDANGGDLTIDSISTRFGTSGSSGTRAMQISYAIGAGSFVDLKSSGDTSGSGGGGTTTTVSYDFLSETVHGTGAIVTPDSVTFRFYAFNGIANRNSYFDDITVNGAATIPEPSTLALVGMALGSVFFFRRRK